MYIYIYVYIYVIINIIITNLIIITIISFFLIVVVVVAVAVFPQCTEITYVSLFPLLLQGVAIEKKKSIQMTKERGFDKYNNNLKT